MWRDFCLLELIPTGQYTDPDPYCPPSQKIVVTASLPEFNCTITIHADHYAAEGQHCTLHSMLASSLLEKYRKAL